MSEWTCPRQRLDKYQYPAGKERRNYENLQPAVYL